MYNQQKPLLCVFIVLIFAITLIIPLEISGEGRGLRIAGQFGGSCSAIAVEGESAYVGLGPGFVALDISDPTLPRRRGQPALFPGMVQSIAVSGTLVYVAVDGSGLYVVDLSSPTGPEPAGIIAG